MKAHWGVQVLLHAFLTSALDEWSASRPTKGYEKTKDSRGGNHVMHSELQFTRPQKK